MKVLITGSTASQTTFGKPTFANFLYESLVHADADVTFVLRPSVDMSMEELEQYDKVLVGIAPPTSVTAYKVYPAFAIAYRAWKLGNLEMFIDAPEPHKLQASINSCRTGKSDLTKDFFSRRKNYSDFVASNQLQNEVNGFIAFLHSKKWPHTYYPAFPWSESRTIYQDSLVMGANSLISLVPDSWLFEKNYVSTENATQSNYWTADATNTVWLRSTREQLTQKVVLAQSKRSETEQDVIDRVRGSIGSLISVYRQGQPWWSPLLAQSLSMDVPVITDWRRTSHMGAEWSYLATSVEEMSHTERYKLASFQKESYMNNIPTWDEVSNELRGILSGDIIVSSSNPLLP